VAHALLRAASRLISTLGAATPADPAILGGKPVVRGTRISVEFILELIASGATADDTVDDHPPVTREDISEALHFAARYLRNDATIELEIAN
jgi:uncharacterized protein (DUF433 family)